MADRINKAVLYDTVWQKLRVSLLSVNNEYGGWENADGARKNISLLSDYVSEAITDTESALRLWRVLNLLNATLLGYGSRKKGTEEERLVIEYRDTISTEYAKVKHHIDSIAAWDWAAQKRNLEEMYANDRGTFNRIKANLALRVKTANRKEKANIGGMAHRGELQKWLDLMKEVEA